jgi:hypothetical protein
MFDKAEDVPFFVAQTSLFTLSGKHPSKGTRKIAKSFFSRNFHFFKAQKWYILEPLPTLQEVVKKVITCGVCKTSSSAGPVLNTEKEEGKGASHQFEEGGVV